VRNEEAPDNARDLDDSPGVSGADGMKGTMRDASKLIVVMTLLLVACGTADPDFPE
jgi:hypothetical protein